PAARARRRGTHRSADRGAPTWSPAVEMSGKPRHLRHRACMVPRMRTAPALVIASLSAATAAAPVAAAPKITVLKAAHLFDGKSDQVVSPGVVVVQDGKITAAGTKVQEPAGAEVIDLGNATLIPGLIDAHTHLTQEGSPDWKKDELDRFKK